MLHESPRRNHDFFIGIDSDGCVFDSMEIKHKECFCPAFINRFDLQAVSTLARETWEFVNLYSSTRGINRFRALVLALDLLRNRREVKERGVQPPRLPELRSWIAHEKSLGNPSLRWKIDHGGSRELRQVLDWSLEVNDAVARIVRNLPPFPAARACLQTMQHRADVVVVSQTPVAALEREWREHDIAGMALMIAGQEMGTKSDHLRLYGGDACAQDSILMVGDAPGDLEAAHSVNALFCPILPGREDECWRRLGEEGLERFFSGTYRGEWQDRLLAGFTGALPDEPPWK